MNRRNIQLNVDGDLNKGISVDFVLDYEGVKLVVKNIQLHSNYDSGLPHSAQLEYHDRAGEWLLRAYYTKEIDGEARRVSEWLTYPLAEEIAKNIVSVKEDEHKVSKEYFYEKQGVPERTYTIRYFYQDQDKKGLCTVHMTGLGSHDSEEEFITSFVFPVDRVGIELDEKAKMIAIRHANDKI